MPFSATKFDAELAKAYGIEWQEDLFAPADEDGRYTTNVEGFFGAQQEWLQKNLPSNGRLLRQNEYGQPELPKRPSRYA
jgi:ParB family transcriptional regulator, chromosome partitioning protein